LLEAAGLALVTTAAAGDAAFEAAAWPVGTQHNASERAMPAHLERSRTELKRV
jgi:hypothetical protein